jgi:predicted TIM-barrel fold metal-dependent hydrolase
MSNSGNEKRDPTQGQGLGPTKGSPLGSMGPPRCDSDIRRRLRDSAAALTVFDTHEHLWHECDRLARPVDFALLLSHYTSSDLVSAGMDPSAVADLQNADIPIAVRWKSVAPHWSFIKTTGYGRCMLIAARDLYGIDDINAQTYAPLSERMAASNQPGLYRRILKDRARIELSVLDDLTTTTGQALRPEPDFYKLVTRFDYIVMASDPKALEHIEQVNGVSVHNLSDLEQALETHVERAISQGLAGIKVALAYDRGLDFDTVPRQDAARAFEMIFSSAQKAADQTTQKLLQDYLFHKVVEHAAEHHLPVQIHTGMLADNQNENMRTNPSLLSNVLNRYREVRFDLFHGGYPYCSELAAMAKNLPNVFADLCWLHIIAPGAARRLLHELIETVPANKILGFGGDFLHVEGAYAHSQMARAITAEVLADKVEDGYLQEDEALVLLERILHQNGRDFFTHTI